MTPSIRCKNNIHNTIIIKNITVENLTACVMRFILRKNSIRNAFNIIIHIHYIHINE